MSWFMWTAVLLYLCVPFIFAKGPPTLSSSVNRRQIAVVGETIRLVCPVDGDPPPLVEWTKDDEDINSGWVRFRMSARSLRIKDATEEDTGAYICEAANGFGSVSFDYMLYVVPNGTTPVLPPEEEMYPGHNILDGEAPHWEKPDQMSQSRIMRPAGNSIRLRCKASGRPRPQIEWFKDGHLLPLGDDGEHTGPRWTLRLKDLTKEDEGRYMCKVFNRAGSINHTYSLEVVDMLSGPIIGDPHPANTTVTWGDIAEFQCHVHSQVQPNIQWLKRQDNPHMLKNKNTTIEFNGTWFIVLQSGQKLLSRNDGSYLNKLLIPHATDKDAGLYICMAMNSKGYSIKGAYLFVQPSPHRMEEPTSSASPSLALIIAVPASVIVLILVVAIYMLQRKKHSTPTHRTVVARPAQHRPPQPPPFPPQEQKHFAEQYTALNPYHMQQAPSRERIVNGYPNMHYPDMHSDISQPKVPMLPQNVPPHMQPLHHQHMHYGC